MCETAELWVVAGGAEKKVNAGEKWAVGESKEHRNTRNKPCNKFCAKNDDLMRWEGKRREKVQIGQIGKRCRLCKCSRRPNVFRREHLEGGRNNLAVKRPVHVLDGRVNCERTR
jgi:hypothetical protein